MQVWVMLAMLAKHVDYSKKMFNCSCSQQLYVSMVWLSPSGHGGSTEYLQAKRQELPGFPHHQTFGILEAEIA